MTKSKNPRPKPSASQNPNPTPPRQAKTAAKRDFEDVPLEIDIDTLRQWNINAEGFARLLIADVLVRIYRLFERIDQAYARQPFLHGTPPDSFANQQRARAHFEDLRRAIELLHNISEVERITRPTKIAVKESEAKKSVAQTSAQPESPAVKGTSDKSPDTNANGSRSRQEKARSSAGKKKSADEKMKWGREFDIET